MERFIKQEAEEEHEDRRGEGDEGCAQNHARAQPCAEGAAALVRIELEDVPEKEHEKDHEEQEHHDREAGEDERLAGGDGIEDADVESLQRAQERKEQKHSAAEQKDGTLSRIAEELHSEIIEAGNRD